MKHGVNEATVTKLPALRRRLEQRYPGVTVEVCERRLYPDCEGYTVRFNAESAKTLISHGLAQWDPKRVNELIATGDPEITGCGMECTDNAYVYHHCYDGEPDMPGSRTYPPKWVIVECERILRRMRRSKRPVRPEP